ncbi:UNVERIFIED_CONTAM: hypothetical protein Slati_2717700 [Sesamum latifolium]|uniref:Uncharacterized protein n=1 Tax=Sesamum latifolium TaxID=2727402 RepID=A0AAW2VW05_9LAMI
MPKKVYFFVPSPTCWQFPTSWISAAPDLPRYSAKSSYSFKLLLKQLNAFHYDPRELVHPTLLFLLWVKSQGSGFGYVGWYILFVYSVSLFWFKQMKELHFNKLTFLVVKMFNKLLQDKALGKGKNPGGSCSSKCPLAKSPSSTPASWASTGDSKGKR